MKVSRTNNRGYTLLEMVVTIALLIIVINTSMKITMSSGRMTAINTLAKDRLIAVQQLDSKLRDAATGVIGMRTEAGRYKATENLSILQLQDNYSIRLIGIIPPSKQFGIVDIHRENSEWVTDKQYFFPLPVEKVKFQTEYFYHGKALIKMEYKLLPERGEKMRNPVLHEVYTCIHTGEGGGLQ